MHMHLLAKTMHRRDTVANKLHGSYVYVDVMATFIGNTTSVRRNGVRIIVIFANLSRGEMDLVGVDHSGG